jgi:tRNA threonylcarbamoyladenosine biosynthesis protein TsaB
MTQRLTLAFDTSFGPVSAALATVDGKLVAQARAENPAGKQAETLPPLVAKLFADAGAGFETLARIVVTVGPGAFTGVRVGLAFAKGLRLATGAPILGVTTLECLGRQAQEKYGDVDVGIVLDAKRGEVFLMALKADGCVSIPAQVLTISAAQKMLASRVGSRGVLAGSGIVLMGDAVAALHCPDAVQIDTRRLAIQGGQMTPGHHEPVPAYLRDADARLPA